MQENLERQSDSNVNKVGRVASVMALSLGITGISGLKGTDTLKETFGQSAVTAKYRGGETKVRAALYLTPTLKGFCSPGACTMNIYDTPHFIAINNADIINLPDEVILPHWFWPKRAVQGKPGDSVPIKCYISDGRPNGPTLAKGRTSTDWYEVIVPMEHVVDAKIKKVMAEPNSPIKIVSFDGQQAVLGWSSVEYSGNDDRVPVKNVPACS